MYWELLSIKYKPLSIHIEMPDNSIIPIANQSKLVAMPRRFAAKRMPANAK